MYMQTGTVKWYNETKGFGFLVDEQQKDVFLHRSGLIGKQILQPGTKVEFEIKDGEKGPVAVKVKVIK
ncbi:MAG: cold-shock protein [Bacteroidetes bacterium GWE2_40_63]|jgi:CspA family cold shock protein|nr:MAG: cold-shock protein [Bacteroidetes bacterium GWA2_40_14]OFX56839.1 MAG: cold-shock protein [Bacteroidetes bacterium GWC2_40_13]OFX76051.1 MAG: cold-shock protein [Bacteroidetes bacterium GWD2_40_43]OFX94335.1 MAG: cold-shock protein [Bacteroidetes bacterium GWE2_40_63]OFY18812.1 MAG: cold-shock protein [Bacteroidetes bacterium GWF2_40_13]OFZ24788.1 MAG: cold-shock protein [Bacteroidetes bacterium RIFOXYC2_FULL_40_12]